MKHVSAVLMTSFLVALSGVVCAQDLDTGSDTPTLRHPFQLLTLAGNVIELPRRDSIPTIQYDLRYSNDDELCGSFQAIISDGIENLVISTQETKLYNGYSTVSWNPVPSRMSSPASMEVLLHNATWYSEIEGMRFRYRALTISQVSMGKFDSCNAVESECDRASYASGEWLQISEFAGTARWGTPVRPGSIHLMGFPSLYDTNGVADYNSQLPSYWLYQFLNIATKDDSSYVLYFRPKNLWVDSGIPDQRGLLVWDISDQNEYEFASCWFEEISNDAVNHN